MRRSTFTCGGVVGKLGVCSGCMVLGVGSGRLQLWVGVNIWRENETVRLGPLCYQSCDRQWSWQSDGRRMEDRVREVAAASFDAAGTKALS